jgi:rhodanese-related sulfurtransferase
MYRSVIRQIFCVSAAACVLLPLFAWADGFMSPGLSPKELQAKLATPRAPLVVDLRKPPECAVAHIPGAVNIPLDELTQRLDALKHENGVLIYCINGARTRQAEPLLYGNDIDKIYRLEGAFQAWLHGKYPVEKGGKREDGW